MAGPVVYVSTYRIRQDQFEAYQRFYDELVRIVDKSEPTVSAFLAFAGDDRSEITYVHVYPDEPTLERHMTVLRESFGLIPGDLAQVLQYLEPVGIQVYGAPTGPAAEMDRGMRESGVPFTGKEQYVGGFTRP